jgi:hypothetical protein
MVAQMILAHRPLLDGVTAAWNKIARSGVPGFRFAGRTDLNSPDESTLAHGALLWGFTGTACVIGGSLGLQSPVIKKGRKS